MDFFTNKFFLLAITFGFYFLSKVIQKKTGWLVLNPILLAIALLICFLRCTDISYETYSEAGSLVEFWLKPAVVALGVPLYLQLKMIRKQLLPILISQLAGCIVGLVAVTIIAKLMGATPEVIMSLAPKSVTTPIAMEVSDSVGGIPSLTAAVVIVVGLFVSFKFSNKVIFYQVLLRLFPVCFPDFIRQIARYPSPKIRKTSSKTIRKIIVNQKRIAKNPLILSIEHRGTEK